MLSQVYEDFGNRIEGAKKFLSSIKNRDISDISTLQLLKVATKDNLWPEPEIGKKDLFVEFIISKFRKCIRSKLNTDSRETIETYIKQLLLLKEMTDSITTEEEIIDLIKHLALLKDENDNYLFDVNLLIARKIKFWELTRSQMDEEFFGIPKEEIPYLKASRRLILKDYDNLVSIDRPGRIVYYKNNRNIYFPLAPDLDASIGKIKNFLIKDNVVISFNISEDEYNFFLEELVKEIIDQECLKKKREKNPRITYPHLENIRHLGSNYRHNINILPRDIQKRFHFFGGQFGNWLPQKERAQILNYAYDAFCDLAKALDIEYRDISFNSKLGIAFGARGSGRSSAHYEPELRVINLTRLRGAGSLAHEWGHSLDHYLSIITGNEVLLQTQRIDKSPIEAMNRIIDYLNDYSNPFRLDAITIDSFEHRKKSYWSQTPELFARAFNSYIIDKLKKKGIVNDYLCYEFNIDLKINGREISAHPKGDVRLKLYNLFEDLIAELKENNILTTGIETIEIPEGDFQLTFISG